MEAAKLIVIILDLIAAVVLTAVIILQSGKSAGLSGAIAGSSDSFMAKGGTKTFDAKLAKFTKWIGLAFVVLSLVAVILISAAASAPAKAQTTTTEPTTQATEEPTTATEEPTTETEEATTETEKATTETEEPTTETEAPTEAE